MKYSFRNKFSKRKLHTEVKSLAFYKGELLRNFKLCTIPLLEFELYFQLFIFLVISPIHNMLLQRLQATGSENMVTYQAFFSYLDNPFSLLYLLLLLLLTLFVCQIELSCLYNIFYAQHKYRKWTVKHLFKDMLKDALRTFKPKNWPLLFWLCILLPIMGNLSMFMPVLRIPDFVWSWLLEHWIYLALTGIGFLACLYYFVHNLYLLPCYFVHNYTFNAARKTSYKLLKKAKRTPELTFIAVYFILLLFKYLLPRLCYEAEITFLNSYPSTAAIYSFVPLIRFTLNFLPFFLQCFTVIISTILINSLFIAQSEVAYGIVTAPYEPVRFFNCKSMILFKHRWIAFLLLITMFSFYFWQLNFLRNVAYYSKEPHYSVTAHRGSTRKACENTYEAVADAITEAADFAEIDVQLSRDNVVYLFHDSTLKRFSGNNVKIRDLFSAELDAVSWHDKDNNNTCKLAKLADVLDLAKGKIKLNIEFKGEAADVEDLVKEVCYLVKTKEQTSEVVFTSLNIGALMQAKKLLPEVKCGYILPVIFSTVKDADCYDFVVINENMLSHKLIKQAKNAGLKVHVWTVNDAEAMKRFAVWGVDSIITDNVQLAQVVRENFKHNYLTYKLIYEKFPYGIT